MEYIKIGQIVNTHGHRGELKIYPLTDDINRYYELKHVYIRQGQGFRRYSVAGARTHRAVVILALEEVRDMTAAEKLKGLYVELPEEELRPLPEGHYYIFQLVGLSVYEEGVLLGTIDEVLKTGSNDVYVVKETSGKLLYLPALKEVVKKIDLAASRIEVAVPPGLRE